MDSRLEFEKWSRRYIPDLKMSIDEGEYIDDEQRNNFEVWQAATKQLEARIRELEAELKSSNKLSMERLDKILSKQLTIDKMRDDVSTAFSKVKDLPRFIFLSPADGGVIRFRDPSGNWLEHYEVIKIYDHLEEQLSLQPSTEELAKHDEMITAEEREACANVADMVKCLSVLAQKEV